jgi:alcohol dehydrogenase class IV
MEKAVFLGDTSSDRLSSILYTIQPKKIFLVRGKNSYEVCGAKSYIENAIADLKCNVYEFFDFAVNPKIEDVEKGLNYLSAHDIDMIIGIGGGSVLDMAKLLRFLHSYKGSILDNHFKKDLGLLPLIVLPTTAGTGAEATRFAVVYQNKIKYSVEHEAILPDISIISPTFTYNNPRYLAACNGFDALAQAIEAYWSINATAESDQYAIKAIKSLWKNLPVAVNEKIRKNMDNVSEGSYWAGKAINIAKTTAPHALSYAFTTYYNIPHGNAVALTFPFFMELNMNIDEENYKGILPFKEYKLKMDILFSLLEIDTSKLTFQIMKKYIESIGLLVSLSFDKEIIIKNINNDRMSNNPRIISQGDIFTALNSIIKINKSMFGNK